MTRWLLAWVGILGGAAAGCVAAAAGGPLPPVAGAARAGDLAGMRALLDHGADPNEIDGRATRWPPLMHALHKGQLDAARLLLEHGADPDGAAPSGYSALMMAIVQDEPDAIGLLMTAGADARAAAANGTTALTQAVTRGLADGCRPRLVRELLAYDPSLTLPATPAGERALWWARVHAALQKARNVAVVPTLRADRALGCGEVLQLAQNAWRP